MNDPPPRISESTEDLAKDLDLVIGRAMAKNPDDRYHSASDFARAFDATLSGTAVAVPERSVARGAAAPSRMATAGGRKVSGPAGATRSARLVFAAGAATALLLAAIVLAVTGALSDDGEADSGAGPSARGAVAIQSIPIDGASAIAIGDGDVWVGSYERDRVIPVDERTGRPGRPIEAGDGPAGLAVGHGSLWVSQTDAGRIGRIDLELRKIVGNPTELSSSDGDVIEIGEGAVWVASPFEGAGEVARIEPGSGKVTERIAIRDGLEGDLAGAGGGIWVVNKKRATVTYVSAASARVEGRPIAVGEKFDDEFAGEVAAGAGHVWATSPEDDTVARIDPRSREVEEVIRVPSGVGGDLAVGLGSVWVVNDSDAIVRIDRARVRSAGDPSPRALWVRRSSRWARTPSG